MSVLKVCILGTGNSAASPACALNMTGHALGGVASGPLDKAIKFAAGFATDFGAIPAFDSLDAMLKACQPQLLLICTPHLNHVDAALTALEHGVNCLIEKPLDIDLDKAMRHKDARDQSRNTPSVLSQTRYITPTCRIKDALDSGAIGRPALGLCHVLHYRDEKYYKSNWWRGSWAHEGGGILVNQSVHELDLLTYFMGRVETVMGGWSNVNHPYIEVDDSAAAMVRFEGGGMASILVSNSISPALSSCVHVTGSSGHTLGICTHEGDEAGAGSKPASSAPYNDVFTLLGSEALTAVQKQDINEFHSRPSSYYYFSKQLDNVAAAIEQGAPLKVTLEDAVNVMHIFHGIYECQRTGQIYTAAS